MAIAALLALTALSLGFDVLWGLLSEDSTWLIVLLLSLAALGVGVAAERRGRLTLASLALIPPALWGAYILAQYGYVWMLLG